MIVSRAVLIVGGGIAGMTLAIALRRSGIECEIVEANPHWTVPGVGISLQGPALRALRAIGVLDQCVGRGFGYSYFKACDADGRVTGTVELPRLNGPDYPATIGIQRRALHEVLRDTVANSEVKVRLGVTVASLSQECDRVAVRFTDGTAGSYSLVVGADGAHSRIREVVFGPDRGPAYTGQAVWRATVRRPAEVQARHSFFGPRNKAGFNPMSVREMYVYLVQNLPSFVRIPDERLPEAMREQLSDFGGPLAAAREEIVDPKAIVYRPVVSHILDEPWYRDRVVLVGDSAHTATPHMAAGAGMAVEDALVLAEVLHSGESLESALKRFMSRRYARCSMVVENSLLLGEWEKHPGTSGADPVGVFDRSMKALAQPI